MILELEQFAQRVDSLRSQLKEVGEGLHMDDMERELTDDEVLASLAKVRNYTQAQQEELYRGLEEAGIKAEPYRLAAVLDHRKNNNPNSMFCACKCFVLCRNLGGEFVPNIETTESGYFSLDDLPEINERKVNLKEFRLCLEAFRAKTWETVFD